MKILKILLPKRLLIARSAASILMAAIETTTSGRDVDNAITHANEMLQYQFPCFGGKPILVGTGGSITSLSAINLELDEYDNDNVHKSTLTIANAEMLMKKLSQMPQDDISQIPSLEEGRDSTILAGAIILHSALQNSQFDELTVSTKSILHGMMLDYQKKK